MLVLAIFGMLVLILALVLAILMLIKPTRRSLMATLGMKLGGYHKYNLPREDLSPQELKILDLVKASLTNRQIGLRLGVSEQTIKNHISTIFSKLQAVNRVDAVVKGLQKGIIHYEPGSISKSRGEIWQ